MSMEDPIIVNRKLTHQTGRCKERTDSHIDRNGGCKARQNSHTDRPGSWKERTD